MKQDNAPFKPINIAVLTVSDTRTEETDTGGRTLVDALQQAGHVLHEKVILPDNKYTLRAKLSAWIDDSETDAVLVTGVTGITGRDVTPEAVLPLLDKEIDGFGELFRWISYKDIGTSTLQSRAFAGVANGTFIFCLPGSPGACNTAWNEIICHQLDARTRPCNMTALMPRLLER